MPSTSPNRPGTPAARAFQHWLMDRLAGLAWAQ
ncbi:hypothetical protein SAMN04489711_102162 [Paracidovorax wautersii]|uniref:Uncharacterized protein n=1 Tax=Paracidovorax wautersii TaxID=1177982 RepID=A0A1I2AQL0_9BURK|nr:hypothetical protein SAMN04489711_102162 [Paracidovorax wautersii]